MDIVVTVINRKIDIMVVGLASIRLYLNKVLKYTTVFTGCEWLPLANKIGGRHL